MLLSVLFNNSSPVVSADEEDQRKTGEGGREGGREKCGVDKLILFCDKKKARITQHSMWWEGRTEGTEERRMEGRQKLSKGKNKGMTEQRNARTKKKRKEASCGLGNE